MRAMSWSDALVKYATVASPAADIPPDVYVLHDDHLYVVFPSLGLQDIRSLILVWPPFSTLIKDAYPKSSYHCLLLPRAPFALPPSPSGSPRSLGTAELSSLQRVLTLPKETILHVLDLMEETLGEVVTSLEETMRKERGWEGVVDLRWGFHAVPSMKSALLFVSWQPLWPPY